MERDWSVFCPQEDHLGLVLFTPSLQHAIKAAEVIANYKSC